MEAMITTTAAQLAFSMPTLYVSACRCVSNGQNAVFSIWGANLPCCTTAPTARRCSISQETKHSGRNLIQAQRQPHPSIDSARPPLAFPFMWPIARVHVLTNRPSTYASLSNDEEESHPTGHQSSVRIGWRRQKELMLLTRSFFRFSFVLLHSILILQSERSSSS